MPANCSPPAPPGLSSSCAHRLQCRPLLSARPLHPPGPCFFPHSASWPCALPAPTIVSIPYFLGCEPTHSSQLNYELLKDRLWSFFFCIQNKYPLPYPAPCSQQGPGYQQVLSKVFSDGQTVRDENRKGKGSLSWA